MLLIVKHIKKNCRGWVVDLPRNSFSASKNSTLVYFFICTWFEWWYNPARVVNWEDCIFIAVASSWHRKNNRENQRSLNIYACELWWGWGGGGGGGGGGGNDSNDSALDPTELWEYRLWINRKSLHKSTTLNIIQSRFILVTFVCPCFSKLIGRDCEP